MTANLRRRKLFSRMFEILCGLAVVIALIPLAMILFYVIKEGAGALNWDFFTKMPKPVGESGGGMANLVFLLPTALLPLWYLRETWRSHRVR